MEEPGRLQSMGSIRVGHDWETSLSLFTFTQWRRQWRPTRVLAWRIPGMAEPGGLPSVGSHRVGHDWSDLAAAARICSQTVKSGCIYWWGYGWCPYNLLSKLKYFKNKRGYQKLLKLCKLWNSHLLTDQWVLLYWWVYKIGLKLIFKKF